MNRVGTSALDGARGALAGALASKVMGRVTTYMYEHQDEKATEREESVRGGKASFEVAAEKAARLFGRELDEDQRKRLGGVMSWALAIGAGTVYGIVRRRLPASKRGMGLLFGTAFFLLVDEGMNTLFRFTPPPRAFPWQAHARGLLGHLTYGLAAELQLRATDAAARRAF